MAEINVVALPGLPEIVRGDELGVLIANAVTKTIRTVNIGDIFIVAQKIVSKAEGAVVKLDEVTPSPAAEEWAAAHQKDPRVVEVIFRESRRIVRMERGIIIAETRHGFVCANAGVDASNVPAGFVTLLPPDPDASAERLRDALIGAFGRSVATIVSDSFGRPWREGVVNVALGVAGLRPLVDYRGCLDPFGRRLESTVMAIADELASAAELVMRKTAGTPVAIVRGAVEWVGEGTGRMLVRDASRDLFR
ncbi:MAG: coenzyme F420-0:L-glutamate ligase [Acidobacteria bacterium 13_1_40CM_65_14]|nr:MAG: coenzyme F420-0:L-glutamate ligase [Acidobacteria bacterium 13_1_40CM_65_14]OLC81612.1 MAG: coenzyme F420-0:L-glutamate ligase [Acidobacteria bacterium 13_1_40CM_4_65_8]